jgi:hypothetical protein
LAKSASEGGNETNLRKIVIEDSGCCTMFAFSVGADSNALCGASKLMSGQRTNAYRF